MADRKRGSPTIVAVNESPSPNGTSVSKRRKVTAEMQQLSNSLADSPGKTLSSVNSSAMVGCDEFCSDHTPSSRFSSSKLTETDDVVKELDVTPLDPEMQIKGFKTVEYSNATKCSLKLFREEEEMDEFFGRFEREEQKRFAEKYNFDIVRDLPLEGRYEWVRLH